MWIDLGLNPDATYCNVSNNEEVMFIVQGNRYNLHFIFNHFFK
jgi:hypothetical protein